MGILGREVILGIGRQREIVKVPEWGGEVILQTLSLAERLEWEAWRETQPKDADNDLTGLLAFTLIDDQGKRLLSVDDIPELSAKSAAVVLRLSKVAGRLNALDAEVGAAKGES